MPRDLTPAVDAQVQAPYFTTCRLFLGQWPSEWLRLTDAAYPIIWNGATYLSTGGMLAAEDLEENGDLKTLQTRLKLSLPDAALFAKVESYSLTGIPISIWRAFLDENGAVIPDPILLMRGFSNGGAYDLTGETADIIIEVVDEMADFDRVKGRRTNHTEQMALYPGDRGFAFVSSQSLIATQWRTPKPD